MLTEVPHISLVDINRQRLQSINECFTGSPAGVLVRLSRRPEFRGTTRKQSGLLVRLLMVDFRRSTTQNRVVCEGDTDVVDNASRVRRRRSCFALRHRVCCNRGTRNATMNLSSCPLFLI